jgi:membrane-associated phospholipid phosphatase
MQTMIYKILKNNAFFLLPYLILAIVAGVILLSYNKADIHIWLNNRWTVAGDLFFRYITLLGDGFFVVSVGILLLLYSLRSSVFLLTSYASTGILVQFLKRVVFGSSLRPSKYFAGNVHLHFVDGVSLMGGHSFPSGHSASAFSMFLCLAIISRNKAIQFLCLVMACLVAYSRVYLSQHFLSDIYVGSLVGVTGTLAFYLVFYRHDKKWHEWSVIKAIRK